MQDKDTLYARWLSGDINQNELIALRKEGALDELEDLIKITDQLAMPKYDTNTGYEKFKKSRTDGKSKVKSINWTWTIAIIIGLVLLMVTWKMSKPEKEKVMFAQNGTNEKIELLDGSIVTINDGSNVKYDAKNWNKERNITLTGEALFQVEKGSPFVVNSKNGSIRVLGTKFNVRAWGNNLYVECYEGKVQVSAGGKEMILIRNEAVNISNASMGEKQIINHQSPLWTAGTSRFQEENIDDVFAELERQYNIKVEGPTINRSFSGNFMHDDLENAARSICKPLGLKYIISEDQKTVRIDQ